MDQPSISRLLEYPNPELPEDDEIFIPVNLIKDDDNTLLAEYCRSIAKTIQFPLSTVYAHALGCIASAMNKSFYVELRGNKNPVNLYVVSSQPPSTGKSGVNDFLSDSISMAYDKLNKNNGPKRAKLIEGKKALTELCKKEKDVDTLVDMGIEIEKLDMELEQNPKYEPIFTNATPEALEQHAFKQRGIFNIVSDEAGSLLTSLGITYGDGNTPSNADIVLQGWDMNRLTNIRVSRDISKGRARGCFAVLAQDETINAILMQGDRGVGISERFLICREKDLLGSRNHMIDNRVNPKLMNQYSNLVHYLVLSDEVTLSLSDDAELFIRERKQDLEPHMGELGKYSNNVMRGVIGKMDKQVCKIASVLHGAENFGSGVSGTTINKKTVEKAYYIYTELTKVYMQTADAKGFHGLNSQVMAIVKYLQSYCEKNVYAIKLRALLDNTKKTQSWKNQEKSTTHFRANIMPLLTKSKICWYSDDANVIYINPKIK